MPKEIKDLKIKSKLDLRKLELSDLNKELVLSKKKYFELKMKLSLNELKQPHLIKILRRNIAILKTIINEKNFNNY